jgi:uncharacterized protein YjbI with pentapeptide repeats
MASSRKVAEKKECAGYLMLREKDPSELTSVHRAACRGAARLEVEDNHYCLMHAPTAEKAKVFSTELKKKLDAGEYNFQGVWFPKETSFEGQKFEGAACFDHSEFSGNVSFAGAEFTGEFDGDVDFQASFVSVLFRGRTEFSKAKFRGSVSFRGAKFCGEKVLFIDTEFAGNDTVFAETEFNCKVVTFWKTIFSTGRVKFDKAEITAGKISFNRVKFWGDQVSFLSTQFIGERLNFQRVIFRAEYTDFSEAKFMSNAYFSYVTFGGFVFFADSVFEKFALFNKVTLQKTAFIDFGLAHFENFTKFNENKVEEGADFCFGEAIFSSPKTTFFNAMDLYPRWFMSIDPGGFNFENVIFKIPVESAEITEELRRVKKYKQKVDAVGGFRTKGDIKAGMDFRRFKSSILSIEEKKPIENHEHERKSYEIIAAACWRLGDNAEANKNYSEASRFRYLAMESHRLLNAGGRAFWTLHWLYWASSGYGERSLRAVLLLIGIWLIFAILYLLPFSSFNRWETRVTNPQEYQAAVSENRIDKEGRVLNFTEAIAYSFGIMSLQKPEPKPLGALTFFLVNLETALGPVQAALLLLAIRRKFMK